MGARKVGSAQLAGARVVGQRLLAVLDLLRAIIVELWLRGGGGAVRGGTPRLMWTVRTVMWTVADFAGAPV